MEMLVTKCRSMFIPTFQYMCTNVSFFSKLGVTFLVQRHGRDLQVITDSARDAKQESLRKLVLGVQCALCTIFLVNTPNMRG